MILPMDAGISPGARAVYARDYSADSMAVPLLPKFFASSARIGCAMAGRPIVFISSTLEDLKEHREQAGKAAEASGFAPSRMEYWSASGRPSLPECLKKVDEAEAVVVIVAHRYGWAPDDPSNPDAKSITWLECEHAWQSGKPVFAFLVDPKYNWPKELYENYRLVEGDDLPERKFNLLRKEVKRNEKKLQQFKQQLNRNLRRARRKSA